MEIINKNHSDDQINLDTYANLLYKVGRKKEAIYWEEKATELGLKPIAKIVSYADAEQAPEWFTTTPSLAVPIAVSKAGLKMEDISFFELNEAFSVVGIVNTQKMNLSPEQVNVNGGAVSLGHPLGCSGARIIVTLINVLKQNKAKYGVAGICNGGGGASAIVIERLS